MGKPAELSVEKVAQLLHKDAQTIRWGLQQQRYPFGVAIQKPNGRWTYNIIPIKFYEYMGMTEKEEISNENN